ncbi:MAG: MFS transporter [Myxococcota bacterium]
MIRRFYPHALIYAGYYGAVGVTVPYFPADLSVRGLSPSEIGVVLSIQSFLGCVLPMLAGYIADRTHSAARMLRALIGSSILTFLLLSTTHGFAQVFPAMFLHAFILTPVLVLVEAATLGELARGRGSYGQVRMFGTLGFALAAFGFGQWIRPEIVAAGWVVKLASASMLVAFIGSLLLRSPEASGGAVDPRRALGLLRVPGVLALCLAGLLHWWAMAPYNAFFALHAERLGFPAWIVGTSMAIGGASEIVFMLLSRPLERRFVPRRLVAFAMFLTAVRWWISGTTASPSTFMIVQAMHGLSFGMFYTAAIASLIRTVPAELRATGQGLFMAATFGIGGGVGTVMFGEFFQRMEGPALFSLAAGADVLAGMVLLLSELRPSQRSASDSGAAADPASARRDPAPDA